ncbi:MAG: type II toxin-antitoxin system RelE/ParE family toxin [SAR324 cluster bacterium]|nr:type II toxin-antitoxin system RelE/ParE family toxin [SAR324 cluster bacterium]
MTFEVILTADAARDLVDIVDFIAAQDAPDKAQHVLDRIERAFAGLAENPERGAHPRELLSLGIREYREVFFMPYRILYQVAETRVMVMLIADGRRDMQTLLQRRLLAP